jgi:hypothetical protein
MNQQNQGTVSPAAPFGNSSKPDHFAALDFSISYLLDGERPEVLSAMLESAAQHLLSNGLITGHTQAVVSEHVITVIPMSEAAANLDEDQVATFLLAQIESGSLKLEDLVSQMARLALTHPAKARGEFAERMGIA